MLRELEAAIDSRDVDRLETAIKKGDAWAKRAPINHFMSQVTAASAVSCTSHLLVMSCARTSRGHVTVPLQVPMQYLPVIDLAGCCQCCMPKYLCRCGRS